MKVSFLPPSELDAHVEVDASTKRILIDPKFYASKGNVVLGTLLVANEKGTILDRAVLKVSGSGNVSVSHCNAPVAPVADASEAPPAEAAPKQPPRQGINPVQVKDGG